MRRILIALLLVGLAGIVPARAAPFCPAPRCFEHSIVLDRYEFRFAVLVPEGYEASSQRYPSLYLFMGGAGGDAFGMNYTGWLKGSEILDFTADQDVIVVLPDHGLGIDSLDGTMKWETFHAGHLIRFVDENYRTIANGRRRAAAGLSLGGWVSMHLAARHPDLFVAAGSFSGYPLNVADPYDTAPDALLASTYIACPPFAGGNDGWNCGGYNPSPGSVVGPLGPFETHEVWWRDNDPTELVSAFQDMSLYLGAGNGVPCDRTDVDTLTIGGSMEDGSAVYHHLESGAHPEASAFSDALSRAGVPHTTDLRSCGIHSWRYFWADLRNFWPLMLDAFGSPPPSEFDYRRADPTFSVWDWMFSADPARAPELLDVADASCGGVGLTGSGLTTVTTARCFTPGASVLVDEIAHTADSDGRLTFTVDLGPAHEHQQYTSAARALEVADADYWTTRRVELEEL